MKDGFKERECIETSALLDAYSTAAIDISDELGDGILAIVDIESEENIYRSFYKSGKLEIERCDAFEVISMADSEITIRAKSYLQAVELEGDYLFSDNYLTMLEGETRTVRFKKFSHDANKISIKSYTLL